MAKKLEIFKILLGSTGQKNISEKCQKSAEISWLFSKMSKSGKACYCKWIELFWKKENHCENKPDWLILSDP